jgi:hypothetical protein
MEMTTVAAAIGVGPEHGGTLTAAAWMLQLTGILLFEVFAHSRRRVLESTLHESEPAPFTVSADGLRRRTLDGPVATPYTCPVPAPTSRTRRAG